MSNLCRRCDGPRCVRGLVDFRAIAANRPADVFQNLSTVEEQRQWVIEAGAHKVKGASRPGYPDHMFFQSYLYLKCTIP